jgi:hypothetical protein
MFQLIQLLDNTSTQKLKLSILVISIVIATQVQYVQHGWINPDSILYLEAAKLFAIGQWKQGFDIFQWPFYSLWIAATHKLTGLGIHQSAQLLNVLFFAIASCAFVTVIQLSGGKQKQIAAGALIFFSAPYLVGSVLEMLMRDEGFWAFFLVSLVFFIRFYQHHKVTDALTWQITIIFATLFRIEAILYLALLPLIFCFGNSTAISIKAKRILQSYCIHLAICLIISIALLLSKDFSVAMLGRLNEIFTSEIASSFTRLLLSKSEIMAEQVLGKFLDEYALPSLILTLAYVMAIKAINATGFVNFGLALLAIRHHSRLIESDSSRVLIYTAFIAILNMALIITKVFVLSGRYVLALSFVLMIFASFYFVHLIEQLERNDKWSLRIVVSIISLLMCLTLIKNILPKQDGYNYMQDSIIWLKENNTSRTPVYYNEARLRYFAGESFIGKWDNDLAVLKSAIDTNEVSNYDLLAIAVSNEQLKHEVFNNYVLKNYKEIKRFSDTKRKKHVVIYKKH